MKRNLTIDMMKGIGILLMVFNHCIVNIYFLHRFIEVFHMPMFFILSGYLYKEKKISDVLKRNFRMILLPYFFTTCIICIYSILSKRDVLWGGVIFLGNARSTCGFGDNYQVGPLWFLTAFFMTMIYAHYIFKLKKELSRACIVVIVFTLSIVYMLMIKTMPPFGILTGLGGLMYLYIGYIVRKYRFDFDSWSDKKKRLAWVILILCYIISVIIGYSPMSWHIYKLWIIDVLGATFGTYLCYRFVSELKEESIISKVLSFCGLNSLAILCIHSVDHTLGITYSLADSLTSNDLKRWQIEVLLKFVFVTIVFAIIYGIKPLRNLYNIKTY